MGFKFAMQQDTFPVDQPIPAGLPQARRSDPFDLDVARKDFEIYRNKIEIMRQDAAKFDVIDAATNDLAVTMMGQARSLSKKINGLKDQKLKPHNDFRTKLIAFTKSFANPLEEIVSQLKRKTETFAYQEILKQRAREKEERDAAIARQAQMDAEAKQAGVETVVLPQIPVDQERRVQTRTESGSSLNITLEWKGIVIDADLVPREYCIPDQKAIDKAILAGVREIAGVEIKEVPRSRLLA